VNAFSKIYGANIARVSQFNNPLEQVVANGGWSNLLAGSCKKALNNQLK
jgi:hypothetical protein